MIPYDLYNYLNEHTIISIGNITSKTCVMVEVITDAPHELVDCVIKNKCYISEIRWWDRTHIALKSKIGYGGPHDPRDPQNYYFAETDLCDTFTEATTFNEYVEYLNNIKSRYPLYDLYPAFDIYKK